MIEQGYVGDGRCVFVLKGRITQKNVAALERGFQELMAAHPDKDLDLDASQLEYISSKGLRALLKLIRENSGKIAIRNTSQSVYPTFEAAGITDLVYVEKPAEGTSTDNAKSESAMLRCAKPPRSVSTDGCEIIGQGRSSIVYLLDSETLVKKYDEHVPLEKICQEMDRARNAFVYGIPTAIPLELVCTDGSYGIIFERIAPADTVGHTIAGHMEKFDEITLKYTELMRQTHHTVVGADACFSAQKDIWLKWVEGMSVFYRTDEIGFLREMVEGIPDRNTMVHCDFHENNVLIEGDRLVLIDMADVGYGHPIFDLAGGAFRAHASLIPGRHAHHGLPADEMQKFWQMVASFYFGMDDAQELEEILNMCLAFGLVRSALFPMKHIHIGADLKQIHIDDARKNLFTRQDWAFQQLEKLTRYFPDEGSRGPVAMGERGIR